MIFIIILLLSYGNICATSYHMDYIPNVEEQNSCQWFPTVADCSRIQLRIVDVQLTVKCIVGFD